MDLLLTLVSAALIASAIRLTVPILLTALGAVFSERGGVVNIGLEGIMIMGTFGGAAVTLFVARGFPEFTAAHPNIAPLVGILAAAFVGTLFALIHAVVSITFRVNQIISGVTINLLAAGLARFLNILFFRVSTQSPGINGFTPISIPLLRDIPGLAPLAKSVSPVIPVALIFGNWWPLGALGASVLFGYFDAFSLRVVNLRIPYQFITVLPHIATILVLAGFVRRAQMPAADGLPYSKEEE